MKDHQQWYYVNPYYLVPDEVLEKNERTSSKIVGGMSAVIALGLVSFAAYELTRLRNLLEAGETDPELIGDEALLDLRILTLGLAGAVVFGCWAWNVAEQDRLAQERALHENFWVKPVDKDLSAAKAWSNFAVGLTLVCAVLAASAIKADSDLGENVGLFAIALAPVIAICQAVSVDFYKEYYTKDHSKTSSDNDNTYYSYLPSRERLQQKWLTGLLGLALLGIIGYGIVGMSGTPDDPKELLFNMENMLKGFGALLVLTGFLTGVKAVSNAMTAPNDTKPPIYSDAVRDNKVVDRFNAAVFMLVLSGAALALTVWGYTQDESPEFKVVAALASALTGMFLYKAGENTAKCIKANRRLDAGDSRQVHQNQGAAPVASYYRNNNNNNNNNHPPSAPLFENNYGPGANNNNYNPR